MAVLVAWFRTGAFGRGAVLLIPLGMQFATVMLFFGGIVVGHLRERRFRAADSLPVCSSRGSASLPASIVLLPADNGFISWVFLLWGFGAAFLEAYATLTVVGLVYLVAFWRKWFKEIGE
jgi:hypothetical protein